MQNSFVALLTQLFLVDPSQSKLDLSKDFHSFFELSLKSNVPQEILELSEDRLKNILDRAGISGWSRKFYTKTYLKYISLMKKCIAYEATMFIAEAMIESFIQEYRDAIRSRDEKMAQIFDSLNVRTLDEAIDKMQRWEDPFQNLEDLKSLKVDLEEQRLHHKKAFGDLYLKITTEQVAGQKFKLEAEQQLYVLIFLRAGASQTGFKPMTILRRMARTLVGMPSLSELQNIHKTIEEYFAVQQNVSNVKLLALENK